jgi:hypothetical protein
MIKKFDCKNCNKQFEADDQGPVVCPMCHSDNVEPAGHHIPTIVWKFIAAIIFIILACGVILFSTSRCEEQSESDGTNLSDSVIWDVSDPPSVSVGQPVFNDNGKYSVDVKEKNVPQGVKFYYVMLSHFDQKVLQKNDDGQFSNIPYCEEDGHSYDFAIMDSRTDTLLCIPVEQTGFVKQVIIDSSKKMTQEQLQKLIDTQDVSLNGVGESDYLAPDYQLKFIGIPSDMKKPESWAELFEMIEYGILDNVTISQLSYDDKNRINMVKLKVTIP